MNKISGRIGLVLLAAVAGIAALEGRAWFAAGLPGLVSSAEARVGRPLTPVSVAGVARRSARRCAVGVYNC